MAAKIGLWWKRFRTRIVIRTHNCIVLTQYYTNLWRYNSLNLTDILTFRRKRRLDAGIPFMITKSMRKQLESLGYKSGDIDKLTPKKAILILKQVQPQTHQAVKKRKTLKQELDTKTRECSKSIPLGSGDQTDQDKKQPQQIKDVIVASKLDKQETHRTNLNQDDKRGAT